ncbi:hypothetical protein Mapa_017361 [Marchantia paleacea]|nr:hypothetical protein Mapa_017361 [Marchantia paleacea]
MSFFHRQESHPQPSQKPREKLRIGSATSENLWVVRFRPFPWTFPDVRLVELIGDPNTLEASIRCPSLHPFPFRVDFLKILHLKILDLQYLNLVNQKDNANKTALMVASFYGNTEAVRILLQCGADASISGVQGLNSLHCAAHEGHLEIVDLILRYGVVDVNVRDKTRDQFTSLHWAAIKNHEEVVDYLLKKMFPKSIRALTTDGMTALMLAAKHGCLEAVRLLLKSSIDPSICDTGSGYNCLHWAASAVDGEPDAVVKEILSSFPKLVNVVQRPHRFGKSSDLTALGVASKNGSTEVVQTLLDFKADPLIDDKNGYNCLHWAACMGHVELLELLLQCLLDHPSQSLAHAVNLPERGGCTPLILASKGGHSEVVNVLLDFRADPHLCDSEGFNLLHWASKRGHLEVLIEVLDRPQFLDMVNILTTGEVLQLSPLMLASQGGHLEAAMYLLRKNASVDSLDKQGWNCLHWAAHNGHSQITTMIACHCATMLDLQTEKEGMTALMLASKMGCSEVLHSLLKSGVNECKKDWGGRTWLHWIVKGGLDPSAELLKSIIRKFPNIVNTQTGDRMTALMFASSTGNVNAVMALLHAKIKADLKLTDDRGFSCLHWAAKNNHSQVLSAILKDHIGSTLVNNKAKNGQTPLMVAAAEGSVKAVETLLRREIMADPKATDDEGFNCLHLAAQHGHADVARLILQAHSELVNTRTSSGRTALMLASSEGNLSVVEELLDQKLTLKLDVTAKDPEDLTFVHLAAMNGHLEMLNEILRREPWAGCVNSMSLSGRTPLMFAAQGGHENVVSMLLQHAGCDEELLDRGGFSFLHLAAQTGQTKVLTLLLDGKADRVYDGEQLWCGGFNPRAETLSNESLERTKKRLRLMETKTKHERLTPLHLAAIGHHSAAVLLLERVYRTLSLKVNNFLFDPVMILLCHQSLTKLDSTDTQKVLGFKRRYWYLQEPDSSTNNSEVVKYFRNARKEFLEPIREAILVKHSDSKDIDWENLKDGWQERYISGKTELEEDISNDGRETIGDGFVFSNFFNLPKVVEVYKSIVEYVNAEDCINRTALHYLSGTCSSQLSVLAAEEEVVLEANCSDTCEDFVGLPTIDINAVDHAGYTPSHLAVKRGNLRVLESIVSTGCNPFKRNAEYRAAARKCSGSNELKEAVSKCNSPGNTGSDYEPEHGYISTFLWNETRDGITPLHIAVEENNVQAVKLLVKANPLDLLARTKCNEAPITLVLPRNPAIYSPGTKLSDDNLLCFSSNRLSEDREHRPNDAMFKLLEDVFISPENYGIDEASRKKLRLELLWSLREVIEQRPVSMADKKKMFLQIKEKDLDYCEELTILHYVAFRGLDDKMKELVDRGKYRELINIPAQAVGGQTPLHVAVIECHTGVVGLLMKKPELVRADEEDRQGRTPYELVKEMMNTSPSSTLKELESSLRADPAVGRYIERQYRDRQIHVDAGNTAMVGAALIASVTFAGWLQPPLGYTDYQQYETPGAPGSHEKFAAVDHYVSVRIFWIFNSLSFFFAVATVVCGARAVLPARPNAFIANEVRLIRSWLMRTSLLLVLSIICVLVAFGAAGFAALPPELKYQRSMLATCSVGSFTCVVFLVFYFIRLNEIGQWLRVQKVLRSLDLSGKHKREDSNVGNGKWRGARKRELYGVGSDKSSITSIKKFLWPFKENFE